VFQTIETVLALIFGAFVAISGASSAYKSSYNNGFTVISIGALIILWYTVRVYFLIVVVNRSRKMVLAEKNVLSLRNKSFGW
jgi:hypothetical protein